MAACVKARAGSRPRAARWRPILTRSSAATVKSRNPKELLGAAHAACFTMSFVRLLGMKNSVPEQLDSKLEVVIDKDGDGSITSVHLTVTAKISGIDQAAFQSIAAKAKAGCPLSKLMNVEIGFTATLAS